MPLPVLSVQQTWSTLVGFGIASTQTRFFRLDVVGGTFELAVSAADLNITGSGETITLVRGGGIGDSFAIFEVTAGASSITSSATLSWQLADDAISFVGTSASIRFAQYSTASAALEDARAVALSQSEIALLGDFQAQDDAKSITEASATATVDVLANDSSGAQFSRFGEVSVSSPVSAISAADVTTELINGQVRVSLSQDFKFLLVGQSAVITIPYTVSGGGSLSDTAVLTVTVTGDTSGRPDLVNGTAAADSIIGTSANDSISGLGGNDSLNGDAGNDSLNGGDGDDTIDGGSGTDRMNGGSGDDTFIVDNSEDIVVEAVGGGTDTVISTVRHLLPEHVENLTLAGSRNFNGVGNAANNRLTGNSGNNVLDGGTGDDTVSGGAGSDTLVGAFGADFLSGGIGGDKLAGGSGRDTLDGGIGADVLRGSRGSDTLTGGDGPDAFLFDTELAGAGIDLITDFAGGIDKIRLDDNVFTAFNATVTALVTADQFASDAGLTTAQDSTDRLIYNTTTGALYYDADGIGGTDSVQIAVLGTSTHPVLTAADFVIVG